MKKEINKSDIDGFKIAKAVKQLEITGISNECFNIKENGVESILTQYGIFYKWNDDELKMLKYILTEIAAKEEIKKAIRWAQTGNEPVIRATPERPMPSPRVLELQQKIYKAEAEKKKELENPVLIGFIKENNKVI